MPYRNGNKVWNATEWTEEMISSLKENYSMMTNKQLADMLGLSLTVTRNKTRELGLKKMTPEYWKPEMTEYLKNNYQQKGDVEIIDYFKIHFPKNKGWTRKHIQKKRQQLGLKRTADQIQKLVKANQSPGGRSFTIDKNSASKNLHPKWVAQQLAWRNKPMQEELLKHPELIELGKSVIKLKRKIKESKK